MKNKTNGTKKNNKYQAINQVNSLNIFNNK